MRLQCIGRVCLLAMCIVHGPSVQHLMCSVQCTMCNVHRSRVQHAMIQCIGRVCNVLLAMYIAHCLSVQHAMCIGKMYYLQCTMCNVHLPSVQQHAMRIGKVWSVLLAMCIVHRVQHVFNMQCVLGKCGEEGEAARGGRSQFTLIPNILLHFEHDHFDHHDFEHDPKYLAAL